MGLNQIAYNFSAQKKMKRKKLTPIDPFSSRRLQTILERFQKGNVILDKSAALARIGFLTTQFDDLDLLALSRAGLLTFGDIAGLVKLGRLPESEKRF